MAQLSTTISAWEQRRLIADQTGSNLSHNNKETITNLERDASYPMPRARRRSTSLSRSACWACGRRKGRRRRTPRQRGRAAAGRWCRSPWLTSWSLARFLEHSIEAGWGGRMTGWYRSQLSASARGFMLKMESPLPVPPFHCREHCYFGID
jgi:hypothetical protein